MSTEGSGPPRLGRLQRAPRPGHRLDGADSLSHFRETAGSSPGADRAVAGPNGDGSVRSLEFDLAAHDPEATIPMETIE